MAAPKHARQQDRGGRTYSWPPTGEQFYSVTTLLKALSKDGLIYWSARMVAEGAVARLEEWLRIRDEEGDEAAVRWLRGLPWESRDKAADVGSAIHGAIEAAVKGTEPPRWPTRHEGFRRQFERFLDAYRPEWLSSEATVFSRTHGYAGTLDFTARIAGVTYLGDLKTGERIYDEVALQLAAYRYADWIDLEDDVEHPMPQVEKVAVLHLRPNGFQLREVDADQAAFAYFLHITQAYRFQVEVAKASRIGDLVTPVNLVPSPVAVPSLDELLAGVA